MEPRLPPNDMRRTPRQDRSRVMVTRIIDAGQRQLLRDGYEKRSTNRVAAEAGISPGSLYQYFSGKEAILAAVVDRYSEELSVRLTAVLADRLDEPGPELVRSSLNGLLDVLSENVEFLRLVVEQLPRAQNGKNTEAVERRVGDLVAAYLSMRRPKTRALEPATSAWILVRMVEHLTIQYVLENPPIPRERFIDELSTMTLAYLSPGPTTLW
ncbi:MAG: TetR/AcrR family transcriptional regulator [Aeromicrobium sp.]